MASPADRRRSLDLFSPRNLPPPSNDHICVLVPKTPQAIAALNSQHNDPYKCFFDNRKPGVSISPAVKTDDSFVVASIGRAPNKSAVHVSDDYISGLHCEIVIHERSLMFMLRDCSKGQIVVVRQKLPSGEQVNSDYAQNRDHPIVLFPSAATSISLNRFNNVLEFDLLWNELYEGNPVVNLAAVKKLRDMARPGFCDRYEETKDSLRSFDSPTSSQNDIRPHHRKFVYDQPPRWAYLKELGKGHHGKVIACVNVDGGDLMAQKEVPLRDKNAKAAVEKAVHHEVEILGSLFHRHILQVLQAFHDRDEFRIFTPHHDGDLSELLKRAKNGGENVTAFQDSLFQQLLAALAYLETEHVVHKDLKPQNILYNHDKGNGRYRFVLADWGLAARGSRLGTQNGTLLFRAPETTVSNKVDVWALCVTMLCFVDDTIYKKSTRGIRKAEVAGIHTMVQNLAAFDPYLGDMAAFDPAQRASARDVLGALRNDGLLLPDVESIVTLSQVATGHTEQALTQVPAVVDESVDVTGQAANPSDEDDQIKGP